jgi:hypothetical protein
MPEFGSRKAAPARLKMELHRQMQLLEWLVAKWGFQEIARPRAEMKKTLSDWFLICGWVKSKHIWWE